MVYFLIKLAFQLWALNVPMNAMSGNQMVALLFVTFSHFCVIAKN